MPISINSAVNSAPAASAAAASAAAAPSSKNRSALALDLAQAKNGETRCSTRASASAMPSSQMARSASALAQLSIRRQTVSSDPKQLERQRKDFRIFSTLYNTNAGAKAVNAAARGDELKISISDVIGEIGRRHGEETVSSYKKAGTDLKTDMKILATKDNLQRVADAMYASADPAKLSDKEIFRGQGMTPAGVDKLFDLWKQGTPVKATHFLSCDKDFKTALGFTRNCGQRREEPVLFQIKSFSNKSLRPYADVLGETETLFTPHATFNIADIKEGKNKEGKKTGLLIVKLKEIPQTENSVLLPY